jgi:hypothetical protein
MNNKYLVEDNICENPYFNYCTVQYILYNDVFKISSKFINTTGEEDNIQFLMYFWAIWTNRI